MKKIDIGENFVYVINDHTFGTDAVLLANFASPKKTDEVLDIGTGCGIIPALILRDKPFLKVSAAEIQKEAFLLAKKSFDAQKLPVKLYNMDINKFEGVLQKSSFSLIICNPPYKKAAGGLVSNNTARATARHELMLDLNSLARVSSLLLKPSGRLCICIRPERLCDVIKCFSNCNLAVKKIKAVAKNYLSEPKLLLIEAKKGAKSEVKILKPLYLYTLGGEPTEEYKNICRY